MELIECIEKLEKSKIKAGDGEKAGKYPLYTCSPKVNKFLDNYLYDTEAIILSTGGNPIINYHKGRFSYSTDCLAIKSNGKFENKYLYYYLISKISDISKMFRGAGIKHLNKKELFQMNINLIDKKEQKIVVKNLDMINNVIELKKKQLEELNTIIKSQFVEMFDNKNYPKIRLKEVLVQDQNVEKIENTRKEKFVTVGINGKGARERIIKDEKWPVPFVGYRVKGGQFIYSRIDARNGAFAIIPNYLNNAVVSKDFPIFDIDYNKIKPDILLFSLLEESFIDIIKNSSFGATNRQRIKERTFLNYKIYLPPIDLQNQFAEIVKQIDKQKFEIEKSLKETQELYESLIEEYFNKSTLKDE